MMNHFQIDDPRLTPNSGDDPIAYALVTAPEAWVFARPESSSARQTQYTFGEPLRIFAEQNGWLYAQSLRDDYCGWLAASQVRQSMQPPITQSHATRYAAPITTSASLKGEPVCMLPPDATFTPDDEQGDYLRIPSLGWLHKNHAMRADEIINPVTTARELLGKSYVWGGRSVTGLDCSALAQLCYRRAERNIPRDADLQAQYLRNHHQTISLDEVQADDLIFIPGHVMLAVNPNTIIHASGHHMLVVEEPLQPALERYQQSLKERYQISIQRW